MAAPYYDMAGLTPMEVVNRVKMIEIPSELALTRKHQVCVVAASQLKMCKLCARTTFCLHMWLLLHSSLNPAA